MEPGTPKAQTLGTADGASSCSASSPYLLAAASSPTSHMIVNLSTRVEDLQRQLDEQGQSSAKKIQRLNDEIESLETSLMQSALLAASGGPGRRSPSASSAAAAIGDDQEAEQRRSPSTSNNTSDENTSPHQKFSSSTVTDDKLAARESKVRKAEETLRKEQQDFQDSVRKMERDFEAWEKRLREREDDIARLEEQLERRQDAAMEELREREKSIQEALAHAAKAEESAMRVTSSVQYVRQVGAVAVRNSSASPPSAAAATSSHHRSLSPNRFAVADPRSSASPTKVPLSSSPPPPPPDYQHESPSPTKSSFSGGAKTSELVKIDQEITSLDREIQLLYAKKMAATASRTYLLKHQPKKPNGKAGFR